MLTCSLLSHISRLAVYNLLKGREEREKEKFAWATFC